MPEEGLRKFIEVFGENIMSIEQAYNYRAVSDTVATAGVLKPKQLAALSKRRY